MKPTTQRWSDEDKRKLADLAQADNLPRAAMLRKLIRDAYAEYLRDCLDERNASPARQVEVKD